MPNPPFDPARGLHERPTAADTPAFIAWAAARYSITLTEEQAHPIVVDEPVGAFLRHNLRWALIDSEWTLLLARYSH